MTMTPSPMDPSNWEAFLRDCFRLQPDAKTPWRHILARHRVWCRSQLDIKTPLVHYLHTKGFRTDYIYDPLTQTRHKAYLGLELLPEAPIALPEPATDADRFMVECCVRSSLARVTYKQLEWAYKEWKRQHRDPDFSRMTASEKHLFLQCFSREFFGCKIYVENAMRVGFYGVALRSCPSATDASPTQEHIHPPASLGKQNRKPVELVQLHPDHPDTDPPCVLQRFHSVGHAASALGVTSAMISIRVHKRTVFDKNHQLRFAEPVEESKN